jgi:diacylglycerol kinase
VLLFRHARRVANSFRFAGYGIRYLYRTQPNFWVHSLAALLAVGLANWLELGNAEIAILIIAIGLVMACEAFNTALEAAVDLAAPDYHDVAKVAKDTAAAGVLVAAVSAALVGLVLLGPPLLRRLGFTLD